MKPYRICIVKNIKMSKIWKVFTMTSLLDKNVHFWVSYSLSFSQLIFFFNLLIFKKKMQWKKIEKKNIAFSVANE